MTSRPPCITLTRLERQIAREMPCCMSRSVVDPLDPAALAGPGPGDGEGDQDEPINFSEEAEPEVVASVRAEERQPPTVAADEDEAADENATDEPAPGEDADASADAAGDADDDTADDD